MYMVGSFEGVCCYAFILYEMVESLKLCVVILWYYMNDWSYKTLEKLLIDVWKWSLKVPNWCPFVSDDIELVWANPGWPSPWVSGVTAVTSFCPQSRLWGCQSHGRDSASNLQWCFALRRPLHPLTRLFWHFLPSIFQLQKWISHAFLFIFIMGRISLIICKLFLLCYALPII